MFVKKDRFFISSCYAGVHSNIWNFQVKKGDRIAQIICEKISHCEFVEVESLDQSERGVSGFGSTGL